MANRGEKCVETKKKQKNKTERRRSKKKTNKSGSIFPFSINESSGLNSFCFKKSFLLFNRCVLMNGNSFVEISANHKK